MENKNVVLRDMYHDYRRPIQFRALDDENGQLIVEGTAVEFDKKYLLFEAYGKKVYEIIKRGAFDTADYADVPLKYNHGDAKGTPARTTAKGEQGKLVIDVTDTGVDIRANLLETTGGKDLYLEIKAGTVPQMSWAFTEDRDAEEVDETDEEITFTVNKVLRVFDVSAVDFGANPNTSIYARRRGEVDDRFKLLLDEKKRKLRAKHLLIKTKLLKEN